MGKELLALLEERSFPIKRLILLASHRSAGEIQSFCGSEFKVQETNQESFKNVDLILASAGSSISRKWKDAIQASGALMIDNSSAFRMDDSVPLMFNCESKLHNDFISIGACSFNEAYSY